MKRLMQSPLVRGVLTVVFFQYTFPLYNGLGEVYFQQDEWHKIGKAIYYTHVDF